MALSGGSHADARDARFEVEGEARSLGGGIRRACYARGESLSLSRAAKGKAQVCTWPEHVGHFRPQALHVSTSSSGTIPRYASYPTTASLPSYSRDPPTSKQLPPQSTCPECCTWASPYPSTYSSPRWHSAAPPPSSTYHYLKHLWHTHFGCPSPSPPFIVPHASSETMWRPYCSTCGAPRFRMPRGALAESTEAADPAAPPAPQLP